MYNIHLNFYSLSDWSVQELLGQRGVYVLWSSRAKERPSYIGEGYVLKRIADNHVRNFRANLEGVVATTGVYDPAAGKYEAEIAECVLLEVANHLDYAPTHNARAGHSRKLREFVEEHRTVRLAVRGLHPFTGRAIKDKDLVTLRHMGPRPIQLETTLAAR